MRWELHLSLWTHEDEEALAHEVAEALSLELGFEPEWTPCVAAIPVRGGPSVAVQLRPLAKAPDFVAIEPRRKRRKKRAKKKRARPSPRRHSASLVRSRQEAFAKLRERADALKLQLGFIPIAACRDIVARESSYLDWEDARRRLLG